MRLFLKIFLISLFTLLFINKQLIAQSTITIDQGGSFSTCNSFFTDSDINTGNYGPNENYTITICSDGTNNANAANFFFLSMDIDPSDSLYVYDGNSTSAPLLGVYNNNVPVPNNILTSTLNNTSSCLTFQFISDGSSEGTGWNAFDSCVVNCQPVDPTITTIPAATVYASDSIYTTICLGDPITFTANGTFPYQNTSPLNYTQTDANTSYEWFFGDGSSATGQTVTHTYQEQSGFLVWLKVTDVQGCIDYYIWKVRVGLTPSFALVAPQEDTVCFNATNVILGGYDPNSGTSSGFSQNQGNTLVGGIVADTTWLPDGTGSSYNSNIEIVGYQGQTITSAADIVDICMNIEHSYIGDLNMSLTCPNGTTITLMDQYNNGNGPGSTFLGDAWDNNTTQGDYGIGMDYCFDMNATWGTMIAENASGNYIPSTVVPGNNILAPGSYQPEQSFTNLIGCPIDGTWTITITDNIGIDDGYIFSWGVNLDPNISPYAETFTVGIDTAYWDPDPTIVSQSNNNLTVQSTNAGIYNYTFNVIDEYGCAYDTTVSFITLPDFTPEAGPDSIMCAGNTYQFEGGLSNQNSFPPCNFTLNMQDLFGDGWNGGSLDIFVNGTLVSNQTVAASTNTYTFTLNDGDVLELSYNSGFFDSEVTYNLVDCNGTTVFSDGPNPTVGTAFTYTYGNPFSFNYTWSPTTGLSNPNIANPILTASTSGYYYMDVQLNGFPQCGIKTDSLYITIDPNTLTPVMTGDTLVCEGTTVTFEAHDALYYLWEDGQTDTITSFLASVDTTVQVIATTSCSIDTLTTFLDVVPYPSPVPVMPTDATLCPGDTYPMDAGGQIDAPYTLTYNWSPAVGLTSATVPNPTFNGSATTTYTLTVETQNYPQCFSFTDSVKITVDTTHILPTILGDTIVCFGNDATITATNALTYMWPDSSLGNSFTIYSEHDTLITLTTTTTCYTDQTPILITVVQLPVTSASPDTTIAIDMSVDLYATGGYSYEWQPFNGLNCNTCDTVTATPNETTTYHITISDSLGCKSYEEVTVNIEFFPFFIPNGFSPNNDGNNDVLYVRGTGIQAVYLQIFDRYGTMMFETKDQSTGWDGNFKGKPVNTGVYIYNAQVFYKDGRTETKNGNITLFR